MGKLKKKRLVRGRGWHGWAFKFTEGKHKGEFGLDYNYDKPGGWADISYGKWVRVKFVEVKEKEDGKRKEAPVER